MFRRTFIAICLTGAQLSRAQIAAPALQDQSVSSVLSGQTAVIIGIQPLIQALATMRAHVGCGPTESLEELALRQQLLEEVQATALDVDGVLGEIANEEGQLSNLRTSLQAKRDSTVAKLNTAALITGSAAGAAVSATQFNTLGSRSNNIGDGFGIGAGVASTIFSILATKKQNGPDGTVGEIPNMLAPLFDESPVLNTYYPPVVLHYLQAIPANEDASRGTRLEQLKAEWRNSGRIGGSTPSSLQHQVDALTSSSNPKVTVKIDELSNRIAMLVDVSGRVSLMKRDLASIMRASRYAPTACKSSQSQ